MECLQRWGEYIGLAVPSTIMVSQFLHAFKIARPLPLQRQICCTSYAPFNHFVNAPNEIHAQRGNTFKISAEAFIVQKLCSNLQLMMQLCLEWWTFEIIILMTGKLREAEVNIGVMGILFQIGGLCYMIPLGLQGQSLKTIPSISAAADSSLASNMDNSVAAYAVYAEAIHNLCLFIGILALNAH